MISSVKVDFEMADTKEKHCRILSTIFQDLDCDLPKFLDTVVNFMDRKTDFASREKESAKKILISAVERHFESKMIEKAKSASKWDPDDSFDNLVPFQDEEKLGKDAWKYAHEVERKKDERKKLQGFSCLVKLYRND